MNYRRYTALCCDATDSDEAAPVSSNLSSSRIGRTPVVVRPDIHGRNSPMLKELELLHCKVGIANVFQALEFKEIQKNCQH